jgi:quinol monooxygenase YgiN
MIVRIAELEIDPPRFAEYAALLRDEIELSLAREPGVLFLQAVSVRGEAGTVRILEGYADQATYEAHLRSAHFLDYKAKTSGMVLALRLLEADPIRVVGKGRSDLQ